MLHSVVTRFRPAPPPPVVEAPPGQRPLWQGLSNEEYRALLMARVDARQDEEALVRRAWREQGQVRARIAAMKRDTEDREAIRSSRFVTTTKGEK